MWNIDLGLAIRTQISICKSPFPSAGTAVSLFRAKTVQQRPLLPREVETRPARYGYIMTLIDLQDYFSYFYLRNSAAYFSGLW